MIGPEKDYAAALFMLAAEEKCVDAFSDALDTVFGLAESEPDWLLFLASPAIPLCERLLAIDEALSTLPEHIVSFVKILCEHGHIRALPACVEEFKRLSQAISNRTVANVTSAAPLDDEQKAALCRKLETLTGKGIDAVYTTDPSLYGGVIVEVEGKTYDGSLRHRLHDVKDVMIR